MKKIIYIILSVLMICLVGCNNNSVVQPGGDSDINIEKTSFITNKSSEYVILVDEKANSNVMYAANELNDFINKVTSVNLPIVSIVSNNKFISLGKTQKLMDKKFDFDYYSLNNDGFYIKNDNGSIFIDSFNDRGLLYGVYEFLEMYLNIKFISPDYTYIPTMDNVDLPLQEIKRVPEFRQRNFYNSWIGKYPKFEARSRMFSDMGTDNEVYGVGTEWYNKIPTHHSCLNYVPKEIYEKTHPEFYSSYTRKDSGYDDLCYTNGITNDGLLDNTKEISVAKAVIDSLKKFISDDEDAVYFMFGIHDNPLGFCNCERCKHSYEVNGSKAGTVNVFANVVMNEIEKWLEVEYPNREVKLVLFAYLWAEEPPVKTVDGKFVPFNDKVKLRDNICVRIAPIEANYAFSMNTDKNLATQKVLNAWSELANELMVWDYTTFYYDGYNQYFPNLYYMKENLQYYKDIGVSYIMNQSAHTSSEDWQSALKYYIASKLYWDLSLNVQDLINEFVLYYHGKDASPYVMQYIDLMENYYADLRSDISGYSFKTVAINAYNGFKYFKIEFLNQAIDILNEGKKAVINNKEITEKEKEFYLKNLDGALLIPQFMVLKNYEDYYGAGKTEWAQDFYQSALNYGVSAVDEITSLVSYVSAFGVK